MQNDSASDCADTHILFVTGQLARRRCALGCRRRVCADKVGFKYSIAVLPITVAALMTPKWLLRKLASARGRHAQSSSLVISNQVIEELQSALESTGCIVDRVTFAILAEIFGKKREKPTRALDRTLDRDFGRDQSRTGTDRSNS